MHSDHHERHRQRRAERHTRSEGAERHAHAGRTPHHAHSQGAEDLVQSLREWMQTFRELSTRGFVDFTRRRSLSMSQMFALSHIDRAGSCAVSEISEDLGVTSAAVSQMLDRLLEQALVERTEDPNDRRVKRIALTEKGKEFMKGMLHARLEWLRQLADTLSAEERQTAVAGLRVLTTALRRTEVAPK